MMKIVTSLRRFAALALAAVLSLSLWQLPARADTLDPAELSEAVLQIEQLDEMRSGLASTLEGSTEEPTIQTFKEVCKPVGMRAKQLSQEKGWQVKQIAKKYRNPAHAPDSESAEVALQVFDENPALVGYWKQESVNGEDGVRYFRRINVEVSCLECHGAKGDRPEFVKEKYPQDLAYDFEVGDLRGMYSVFIPYLKQ
jgi:hypothetical protein